MPATPTPASSSSSRCSRRSSLTHGATNIVARDGIWAAAILFPAGFFDSSAGRGAIKPNKLILLLYLGVAALTAGALALGIGLLTA